MILLPAQIETISSRKDKTIRLTIGTQELTPNKAAEIFGLNQQFVYLAIKPEAFNKSEQEDIDNLKADYETNKTPSQRLRAILYKNYEQTPEGYKDFTTYYLYQMEKMCDYFKAKLL